MINTPLNFLLSVLLQSKHFIQSCRTDGFCFPFLNLRWAFLETFSLLFSRNKLLLPRLSEIYWAKIFFTSPDGTVLQNVYQDINIISYEGRIHRAHGSVSTLALNTGLTWHSRGMQGNMCHILSKHVFSEALIQKFF